MKKACPLFVFLLFLFTTSLVNAQTGQDLEILPGGVFVSDTLTRVSVKHDVAFNGWLFAGVNLRSPSLGDFLAIVRSKDGGETWKLISALFGDSQIIFFPSFDLVVAGNDTANLWLYVAITSHNLSAGDYGVNLVKVNASSDSINGSNLYIYSTTNPIIDAAIASDYRFPAVGASPYSVAMVYSVGSASADSIKYVASIDGGATASITETVTLTGSYFRKVDIAYGRSPSASNGRYFVAWEKLTFGRNDLTGSIFTSRNSTSITSPFTVPVNLDSLGAGMIGRCRNPSITVQHNNMDNDSSGCTAVVLFEHNYMGLGTDYDVRGFYNKRGHFSDYWNNFAIANTNNNDMQGSITFDPGNNNFHATYFDSTNIRLPYRTNEMNLLAPNTWTFADSNYADSGNLNGNALPQVKVNPGNNKATFTWVSNVPGDGAAFYDADGRPVFSSISGQFCSGTPYNFNGQIVTSGGIYRDTLVAANGVDSIIILTLLGFTPPVPTITKSGNILTTETYSSYQWQFNGGDILGANSQTYTATQSGAYTVVVIDNNGCTGTSTPAGVIVGIEEAKAYGITIYPTLINDMLYLDAGQHKKALVTISDVAGRQVLSKKIAGKETLEMSHLAPGTYFLQFKTAGKTVAVKLVKE